MHRRTWAALALAGLAASCASPYGQNTLFGGYRDTKIDDSHYQVRYDGNGNTSEEKVWNYWIHRCAELTKEKGFTHFSLERPGAKTSGLPADAIRENAYTRLGEQQAGGDEPRFVQTKGGGYTYIPIYTPGVQVRTWHTNAIVTMINEPIPQGTLLFRAEAVLEALGPYVKSGGVDKPISRDELYKRAMVYKLANPDNSMTGPL